MTVDAVVSQVGLSAYEPLDKGFMPLADFVPRLKPVQFASDVAPKRIRVV